MKMINSVLKAALCRGFVVLLFVVPSKVLAQHDYVLGTGDIISISVYGESDLSFDQVLLGDKGMVNYPFLGQLRVSGLSVADLEELIHSGLKGDYLVTPNVRVGIVEYRPFFINGEVESPGGYPYQPGLTVGKAVTLAKGFTERAAKKGINVSREIGDSKQIVVAALDTPVHPGDVITVDESFF